MKYPQLWTLTINAAAYPDQLRIFEWLKKKNAVAEWVRSLDRRGLLSSPEYFCAIEFQMGDRLEDGSEGTLQVHFHVLLDVGPGYGRGFLDHSIASEAWNRFAAPWRIPEAPHAPLGFVQFEKVYTLSGMSRYLCKYLAKGPKDGVPPWFLEWLETETPKGTKRKVVLHSASKGFFRTRDANKKLPPEERAIVEADAEKAWLKLMGQYKPKQRRSIEERLAACCSAGVVVAVRPVLGGHKRDYLGPLNGSFPLAVRHRCGSGERSEALRAGRFEVSAEVARVMVPKGDRGRIDKYLEWESDIGAISQVSNGEWEDYEKLLQLIETGPPGTDLRKARTGSDSVATGGGGKTGSLSGVDVERGGAAMDEPPGNGPGACEAGPERWAWLNSRGGWDRVAPHILRRNAVSSCGAPAADSRAAREPLGVSPQAREGQGAADAIRLGGGPAITPLPQAPPPSPAGPGQAGGETGPPAGSAAADGVAPRGAADLQRAQTDVDYSGSTPLDSPETEFG